MTTTDTVATPRVAASDVSALVALKGDRRIGVCVPARDEAPTIGDVVAGIAVLHDRGLVDELVVVDDGSRDGTSDVASRAGARVIGHDAGPGKGQALRAGVRATSADLLVFVDADVSNFDARFVTALVEPILRDRTIAMVKPRYRRPLQGVADEGGRVTELLARPLLRRFHPELLHIAQPLGGECALRRDVLDAVTLADGYGVEVGLLLDVTAMFGVSTIAEVDLGERVHRNRPLLDLRPHCDDVLAAVLERLGPRSLGSQSVRRGFGSDRVARPPT